MGPGTPPKVVAASERLALMARSSFSPVEIAVGDGKFRACGFYPGEYRLEATGTESHGAGTAGIYRYQMDARAQVEITDRDADEVRLTPRSALTVEGEATLEGTDKADVSLRVGLLRAKEHSPADQPGSGGGLMSSVSYGNRVAAPGAFTVGPLPPDEYELQIRELPEGCYVKGATFGGESVLHRGLQLGEAAGQRLHLAIACDGGSLAARVTDGNGNPVSHLRMYVMPSETPSAAALSGDLMEGDVDNGWSEVVKPLAPGKYLAMACELETDGTAAPIIKLWQARGKAKEVEIGAGQKAQITLESIELR